MFVNQTSERLRALSIEVRSSRATQLLLPFTASSANKWTNHRTIIQASQEVPLDAAFARARHASKYF